MARVKFNLVLIKLKMVFESESSIGLPAP